MSKSRIAVLIGVLVFVGSCQSRKFATPDTVYDEMKPVKVFKTLEDNSATWDTYSSRISTRYKDEYTSMTFTAKVRMKRDSIMWVSITAALGIEVVRAQITPDRVLVINRLDRSYLDSDFNSLSRKLGAPVNFNTLQNTFSGSSLFVWKRRDVYGQTDSAYYVLSNHPPAGRDDSSSISFFFETMRVSIAKLEIEEQNVWDPIGDRYLSVQNDGFEWVNDRSWPTRLNIEARDSVTATTVQMRANKIETDIVLSFPFEIPDDYAPITW